MASCDARHFFCTYSFVLYLLIRTFVAVLPCYGVEVTNIIHT